MLYYGDLSLNSQSPRYACDYGIMIFVKLMHIKELIALIIFLHNSYDLYHFSQLLVETFPTGGEVSLGTFGVKASCDSQ